MQKSEAATLLAKFDLGSGVAETDTLLESARVETSVFDDLLADRVDLIPGTKGSGKTALYRIFLDFVPHLLLKDRRVVIAHGVQHRQDSVFLAFRTQFDALSEADFVDFWIIYVVSLAHEKFIKSDAYSHLLKGCEEEVGAFREAYRNARIPEFEKQLTLKEIIGWVLAALMRLKPKVSVKVLDIGQIELTLDDKPSTTAKSRTERAITTAHAERLKETLDNLLDKSDLSLWLMIDRLDELFERRSKTEQKGLRGLLQTLRIFGHRRIRVKIFLRDDILEHIVDKQGFTALSHVTSRRSDTLRWSEEQILAMVTRRIFANKIFRDAFNVDERILASSVEYQRQSFYKIFADTVYRPPNQSGTLRWIYNHTKDGRGVVTPRDVIFLITRACQWQRDAWRRDPEDETDRLVFGPAIIYGLEELSKEKRTVYLEAEFPRKWTDIRKLIGGGTEYGEEALKRLW